MEKLDDVVTSLGNDRYRLNYRVRVNGVDIAPTEVNNIPINGFNLSSLVGKTVWGRYEGNTFVIEKFS